MHARTFRLWLAVTLAMACHNLNAQESVPTAVNLGAIGAKRWSTDRPPAIAVSDSGVIYVLWSRPAQEMAEQHEGIPPIPGEFAFDDAPEAEESHVPAICIRRDGKWSSPRLLIGGRKQCDPRYAWCDGEKLHLLLSGPKGKCNHLIYDPETDKWMRLVELDSAPKVDDPIRRIGNQLHCATADANLISYLHFDGSKWDKPLKFETGESGGPNAALIRLAVVRDGTVHIVWWGMNTGKGAYGAAVIRDEAATTSTLKLEGSPIHKDAFDLGVDSDDRLFLAYKPEPATGRAEENQIHIRKLLNNAWSDPTRIADANTGLLGAVSVIGDGQKAVVTWIAQERQRLGKGSVDRRVRRLSIGDGQIWQKPQLLATADNPSSKDGVPFAPERIAWCVDKKGDVHVVWGSPEAFYCLAAKSGAFQSREPR